LFRADSDTAENLSRLRTRVHEGVSKLRGLEIGDELAIEILAQLVDGRKSTAEIVELIYGLRKGDEGFISCYSRVGREIKRLESKGLVSRQLFGRDKPYRLTELAVTNLARIGGEKKQMALVPKGELLVYLVTIALAVPIASQTLNLLQLGDLGTAVIFPCFCFFLGFSCSKVLQTLGRVL
jgi:hypothetical protein